MMRLLCLALFLSTLSLSARAADNSSPGANAANAVATDASQSESVISVSQAAILGLVEGLTEYLPVSSTGHLVVADQLLGLRDQSKLSEAEYSAVEAYEIIIQAGAILAVLILYGVHVKRMVLGLFGKSEDGRRLLINIVAAFIPTAVIGLALHSIIKHYLQSIWPVVFALAAGGIAMMLFSRSKIAKKSRQEGRTIDSLTWKEGVQLGLWQCLALWPGTSRSMSTIIGGMVVGLTPVAAAEFSFILGLPTLLAATGFKLVKDGRVLFDHVGLTPMLVGMAIAAVAAAIAVRGLVSYLTKRGLGPFGWYRVFLAVTVMVILS